MQITNPAALVAAESNPPVTTTARDLRSMSVRELLSELAATENVLRQRPNESLHRWTVRRQVLLVGELRRRRRKGRVRELRRPLVVGDSGARVGG